MTIEQEILSMWKQAEKSLRKDKVGRELYRELLKRVYKKSKYQNE